jgi:hypothetical protein
MQSNEMIHTLQVINSGYLGHGLEDMEKWIAFSWAAKMYIEHLG